MRKTKTVKRLSLIAAVALLGAGSFLTVRHLLSQAILNSPKRPYTMHVHHKVYRPDGTIHNQKTVVYARRGDGSKAERHSGTRPDGRAVRFTKLALVPDRKRVTIHDTTGSVTTEHVPLAAVLHAQSQPSDPTCRTHVALPFRVVGTGEVAGLQVVKRVLEKEGHRSEEWLAPELHCAALYWRSEDRNPDGTLQAVAEETTVSVTLGEPSPELFEIPSNHTEHSPIEVMRLLAGPEGCEDCINTEAWQKREQAYRDSSQYAPAE